ncbi:MAG TPA: N-acetylmuramic acid 6-phosphate etherase, partial [Bacteroidota bacterium]|nr:N-acetylmuramic acid 6-phosphate etherase [Bacteroidota bacterium]
EVITGSTRMKAGTAQKLILNMLTTASMIQIGKVYKNMMVDLKLNSKKLEERAKRILMSTTHVNYQTATDFLLRANGHVKTALVMIEKNVSASEARKRLMKADGYVRKALGSLTSPKFKTR